jgi:predicted kinase
VKCACPYFLLFAKTVKGRGIQGETMKTGPVGFNPETVPVIAAKSAMPIAATRNESDQPAIDITDGYNRGTGGSDLKLLAPGAIKPPPEGKMKAPVQLDLDLGPPPEPQAPQQAAFTLSPDPMSLNNNGTLSVIEQPGAFGSAGEAGGVNFAKLFGVDSPPERAVPQQFSREEVEKFYFTRSGPQGPGELSAEGERLYETIKARYIDKIPLCPHGTPTLYLTGGLPGSGKGYILSKMMREKPEFVLVDPDEIKKHIMKDLMQANPGLKDQMVNNADWGLTVHETSSAMAKQLMDDALQSGRDIVFDSSMASGNVDKYRKYARVARQNGYRVNAIISDVSEETAVKRALKRAGVTTTIPLERENVHLPGRLTRSDYIHECAQNFQHNLDTYLDEGVFDRCVIFDNNDAVPRPRASYVRFQRQDGSYGMTESNPAAQSWLPSMTPPKSELN